MPALPPDEQPDHGLFSLPGRELSFGYPKGVSEARATAEFRLSITKALGDQLEASLLTLSPAPLTLDRLAEIQARSGVYQLYYRHKWVYVGKAEQSLPERLADHLRKISGRANISLDDMGFTALYVEEDLSAVAPETLLINKHKSAGGIPWNQAGFGNHDPGRNRDSSQVDKDHWDAVYPVNLKLPCGGISAGTYQVVELLRKIKGALPFLFRYEGGGKSAKAQPNDYHQAFATIPHDDPTADESFSVIATALPGWQLTALPGYVIMYHEQKYYPSAQKVY